jgi:hypothetical protein
MAKEYRGILGIIKQTDGEFRCRGIGEAYEQFYDWLKTTSYECTGEDWPWDYFKFNDPADEAQMRIIWAEHMMEDDKDED